jgi:hypothetical protein
VAALRSAPHDGHPHVEAALALAAVAVAVASLAEQVREVRETRRAAFDEAVAEEAALRAARPCHLAVLPGGRG